MGAWGEGIYDNDAALDFVYQIENTSDIKKLFFNTFQLAIHSEYLDSEEASSVLVAASYMEPLAVDSFKSRFPDIDLSDLKDICLQAIQKVISPHSELKELWDETIDENEVSQWELLVRELKTRLK